MTLLTRLQVAARRHWPHYVAEAAGLAFFVACASLLTVLLEHPSSGVRQALALHPLGRRALMGVGMGFVIVAVVYSPWGKRSGAHINPAVTLGFWQLGKISTADALWYVAAQTVGGTAAAWALNAFLHQWLAHPAIGYNQTLPPPGPNGWWLALGAEALISFVLMLVLLWALHSARFKTYTGWLVGVLLAVYIVVETPYSGMSLNPARSLATALVAGNLHHYWIYVAGPCAGTWLATVLFLRWHHGQSLACAILAGCEAAANSPHATEPPHYPDRTAAD
ncbi:aquaporin family protein [Hymenobacter busanensis]|uniref:Aquaporin family protein n=1 Tax=Hymenobacter busanensis TaxID=2607656 RepID=A0A7L4ZXH8_9BACT|nr:aquaporin [Hymenobacter busanensis]KAA9333111.1 aquaporin family protein [Hymenobacter busanensis]QHJ08214.1 aquaporin family protein [Hymenobacter busanensis]